MKNKIFIKIFKPFISVVLIGMCLAAYIPVNAKATNQNQAETFYSVLLPTNSATGDNNGDNNDNSDVSNTNNSEVVSSGPSYELVFDPYYYYGKYKDKINIKVPTAVKLKEHFIKIGMRRGYEGNASFNVQSYKERYEDLQAAFGNDYKKYYYHYMLCGNSEGRDGSFNQELYELEMANHKAPQIKEVTDDEIRNYYDKAVFIGDSVMVGYMYYAGAHSDSWVNKSDFLAQYSTAIRHSIVDISEDPYQPSYKGEKMNVWNATPQMDIDKIFIMYGANDLGVYNPQITYDWYIELIDKIRATTPNVEIHIISMTPVGAEKEGKNLNNVNVNTFNQLIIDGAEEHNYYYVSLNPSLLDDAGCLISSYSTDKLVHLTTAAYADIWEPVFHEYARQQLAGEYEIPATYDISIFDK